MDASLNNRLSVPQEMALKMRSVDGSVYSITTRNTLDYVLHPEFLRFVVIACAIYALLRGDGDVPGVSGWPFVAVWTLVLTVMLLWLALCGSILARLLENGVIRQVWTPLLLVPLNLIIESSVQGAMFWFADQPLKPWGTTISDLTRDLLILLLLDLLHGHYVVAKHPYARIPNQRSASGDPKDATNVPRQATAGTLVLASRSEPEVSRTPNAAAEKAPVTASSAQVSPAAAGETPPAAAKPTSVRIGTQSFVLTDILMVRIEDHYLSITTSSGRSMQRAKLSAVEELHKGDVGIQINRSVWVAFKAIRSVEPAKNGQILLTLINGDEEVVAKPRVYAFRQAYRITVTRAD